MRENRLLLAATVALLLGCGSSPTRADDQKDPKDQPPAEKKDDKKDEKKDDAKADKPAEKAPAKVRSFKVTVTDNFNTKPFTIEDAVIWVPEVSILSGEGGKATYSLFVKRGAAEIEVPLEDIAEVKGIKAAAKEPDRLECTVVFKNGDPEITGTIKANLSLQGRYDKSKLTAKCKLREITSFKVEETTEKK
jgi:hypothetical protein